MMQRIMLNLVAVAAVVGWVMAFLSMSESSDLEERLATAKARLTNSQRQLALQQGSLGNLKDIDERMAAKQAEAAALAEEIEATKSELGTLRQELESGKMELGGLADRVAASKAVLSRLTQDREGAKAALSWLLAETERQRETPIDSPAATQAAIRAPEVPAAPITVPASPEAATPEAASVVAKPAVEPLADARRRFARIDQDGDGRFDRLELRVKRVSLFVLVDANADNYLTLDETLLTPEAFEGFDADGDGKISPSELADRGSFDRMDSDGDGSITFEEYAKFLRIGLE
jgi:peptidoglycan hydrolase CwlO-like protein